MLRTGSRDLQRKGWVAWGGQGRGRQRTLGHWTVMRPSQRREGRLPLSCRADLPCGPALSGAAQRGGSTLRESLRELPGAGGDVRVQLCQCKALPAARRTALLALASRWEVEE